MEADCEQVLHPLRVATTLWWWTKKLLMTDIEAENLSLFLKFFSIFKTNHSLKYNHLQIKRSVSFLAACMRIWIYRPEDKKGRTLSNCGIFFCLFTCLFVFRQSYWTLTRKYCWHANINKKTSKYLSGLFQNKVWPVRQCVCMHTGVLI